MSIEIKDITTRRELKDFIFLPAKIHSRRKNWVPPIYRDEWRYFNPRRNKAFSYCDTKLQLAYRDGRPVGRIMGIINNRYNSHRGEKIARFGYLESWEDWEVVQALLNSIEQWARERAMVRIIGPYGFTDQDPEGFLIKGFENRATIATYYNMEWMPEMVERQGYIKDVDYFVYKVDIPKIFPDFYHRIYDRVQKKGQFQVLEFQKKKDLIPWIKPVFNLMNECYSGSHLYGFTPLDEREMDELAKRYLPVIDPRFVKAVQKDGELVSFVIGMPDITEGIQKAKGRLFPFGFIKILRAAKTTKQLDLLLGAVKEPYRGRGLDVMMGVKMFTSAHKAGLVFFDTHHELEANVRVRGEMEKLGGKIYKIFRVFTKNL